MLLGSTEAEYSTLANDRLRTRPTQIVHRHADSSLIVARTRPKSPPPTRRGASSNLDLIVIIGRLSDSLAVPRRRSIASGSVAADVEALRTFVGPGSGLGVAGRRGAPQTVGRPVGNGSRPEA